jgi:arginine decarboxylase-like protein
MAMTSEEQYKQKTGENATYKSNGATWHFLRYIKWLESENDYHKRLAEAAGKYAYATYKFYHGYISLLEFSKIEEEYYSILHERDNEVTK